MNEQLPSSKKGIEDFKQIRPAILKNQANLIDFFGRKILFFLPYAQPRLIGTMLRQTRKSDQ